MIALTHCYTLKRQTTCVLGCSGLRGPHSQIAQVSEPDIVTDAPHRCSCVGSLDGGGGGTKHSSQASLCVAVFKGNAMAVRELLRGAQTQTQRTKEGREGRCDSDCLHLNFCLYPAKKTHRAFQSVRVRGCPTFVGAISIARCAIVCGVAFQQGPSAEGPYFWPLQPRGPCTRWGKRTRHRSGRTFSVVLPSRCRSTLRMKVRASPSLSYIALSTTQWWHRNELTKAGDKHSRQTCASIGERCNPVCSGISGVIRSG